MDLRSATVRLGLFFVAALILPLSVSAQAVLSVTPASLSIQANVGQNVPSQTVNIDNDGNQALKWSIASPTTWISVSPTSGVQRGTVTVSFSSNLPAGNHSGSFTVTTPESAVTVPVQLTIGSASAPPPPPPSGDWTFCASEGGFCAFAGTREVRYGANGAYSYRTLSDGTACTNSVFGDPIAGTPKQCHIGAASTSPPPPPPPSPSAVGPQSTITCPAGAVDIFPGIDIQGIVNLNTGTTTFCLRAGSHSRRSSITPKTGNTFVGEYGAILDGTGWTTTDSTQGAFRAHNQDIDNVTIRNLVIRNMPQKGIHAFYWMSPDNWTIEYNEIAFNHSGILFPNHSIIRNNYIHHNLGTNPSSPIAAERGGGYGGYYASYTTFDTNEIAYNGMEQKVMDSVNVTFRNNFVHHNVGDGIWYDGGNPNAIVEGNRVEDNGRNGIFYEASSGVVIRNNTIRRSGDTGVFISTSQNAQIYNNTLENNFRSIVYFVNCGATADGRNLDLMNISAYDNAIRIGTQSGAFGNGFSYTSDCTSTQVAAYVNGSKNLTFSRNTYYVPSLTGWYWLWNGPRDWFGWQSIGHDRDGSIAP